MSPLTHPRGLFSGRPVKGIPPSLSRIVLGLALVLAVWNEGFYAFRSHQLDMPEVRTANPSAVDPGQEGRDIHLAGPLTASAPAADPLFGPVPNSAVLRRTEERRTGMRYARGANAGRKEAVWGSPERGGTTISHAAGLSLGAYPIDAPSLASIGRFQPVAATRELANQIAIAAPKHRVEISGDWYVIESTLPPAEDAEFIPAFRIRFEQIPLAPMTLAGRVNAGVLHPVADSSGMHSAERVVETSRTQATFVHWAIRLIAGVSIFAGIHLHRQSKDLIRLYGPGYFPKP